MRHEEASLTRNIKSCPFKSIDCPLQKNQVSVHLFLFVGKKYSLYKHTLQKYAYLVLLHLEEVNTSKKATV